MKQVICKYFPLCKKSYGREDVVKCWHGKPHTKDYGCNCICIYIHDAVPKESGKNHCIPEIKIKDLEVK